VDHNPNEKKNRVKSKRGRAVKKVLNGRLKISREQNTMVRIPITKGIIFTVKNSFLENSACASENGSADPLSGNLNEINKYVSLPPM
jgi:hypothetical protein